MLKFIYIALFDIWVCHRDRTQNNANLLRTENAKFNFIAIDHSSIFDNGNEYGRDLPISIEKSLLTTNYFKKYYPKHHIALSSEFSIIKTGFENKVAATKLQLDTIFENIPIEICSEKDKIERKEWLKTVLCSNERVADVWQAFENYLISNF